MDIFKVIFHVFSIVHFFSALDVDLSVMFQSSSHTPSGLIINQEAIDKRLSDLDSILQSTKYSQQKTKLQMELTQFFSTLSPIKSLTVALPSDIRRFLVYKDSKGKTQVHHSTCEFQSQHGVFKCGCPLRLSAGSVDSLIGQVRAIFRDTGRGTEWNAPLGIGNPASAPMIKQYLSAVKLEQSYLHVTPKQAPPLFFNKVFKVLRHISFQEHNPKLSLPQRYLLKRDKTFFNLLSFTGDRAGDLGYLKSNEICYLPDGSGISFLLTKGKTVNSRHPRRVILFYSHSLEFCPVKELISYLTFCQEKGINIKDGYVFRPLDSSLESLSDNPFSSSNANARLKLYLTRLRLWDGETPHSTRSACALTLSWLGIDNDAIKSHVGWKSDSMLQHYISGRNFGKNDTAAHALSGLASTGASELHRKLDLYKDVQSFKKVLQ